MSTASGPSAITRPRTSVSRPTPCSALDAEHLLERVDHLDEIGLVRHHLVDVLVGAWNFVEHALVLAADDALRLALQVLHGECLLCRIAAHPAPGAVRTRLEALGVAGAAHDVAPRAHAAGNDAELAAAGADRPLAREPHRLAVMHLALDVV